MTQTVWIVITSFRLNQFKKIDKTNSDCRKKLALKVGWTEQWVKSRDP